MLLRYDMINANISEVVICAFVPKKHISGSYFHFVFRIPTPFPAFKLFYDIS
jgi:hypothetical protein